MSDRRQLRANHRSHTDIVNADDREVVRHLQAFVLNAVNRANRHFVRCRKDRSRPLLQPEEILHRFHTGFITIVANPHQILLVLNARRLQRALVPLESRITVRRILQRSADHRNLAMSMTDQRADRVKSRRFVVDIHGRIQSVLVARCAKHDWHRGRLERLNMFLRYGSAHEEEPVHLLLEQRVDDANLLLFALVGITQNNVIVIHVCNIFDAPSDFRKDRIRNIGDDHTYSGGLLAGKTPGYGIGPVA
ncbi:hypothetical protein D3C81_1208230 [compost metagenome]